jgi:hypothetical protein
MINMYMWHLASSTYGSTPLSSCMVSCTHSMKPYSTICKCYKPKEMSKLMRSINDQGPTPLLSH